VRRPIVDLASATAAAYLRWLAATARLRPVDDGEAELRRRFPPPYLVAFWHRHLVLAACSFRGPEYAAMVSEHRDGDLMARCLGAVGTGCIRGSSRGGAEKAVRSALRALERGISVAVTPDGPVGPARRVRPGVVALAARSGVPLVPVGFAARPAIPAFSWDRLLLPFPWSRIAVAVGSPLEITSVSTPGQLEAWCHGLESRLEEVTAAARGGHGVTGREHLQATRRNSSEAH
jgi:lysophospholipid acyltransferase (LPLAT)-like uncharacterized protein